MSLQIRLLRDTIRERLTYDLGLLRPGLARGLYGGAALAQRLGHNIKAYELLTRLHRMSWSAGINQKILDQIRSATSAEKDGRATGLWNYYEETIRRTIVSEFGKRVRLLGSRVLVVKTSRPGQRGVLVADYSPIFPLLASVFDIRAILDRYFIVLDPSWSGLCTPEVLLYSRYDDPVFVQTGEPVDKEFIERLETNLVTVPVAANWWVDYRPLLSSPREGRDIDIIMVAAWATFKRHWRFFRVLRTLKKRGHKLKVTLVGYPADKSKHDVLQEAEYFGVSDQVQMFEWISPEEVAQLLGRSKLHILWSRKEGFNRAIIEAMFADVPVIMREGFNFGYRYPYINDATGRFATEENLADTILDMLDRHNSFSPRDWVMQHMTCQLATSALAQQIKIKAAALGEDWTEDLVVKTTKLNSQEYWNSQDRERFESDYAFLESTRLPR